MLDLKLPDALDHLISDVYNVLTLCKKEFGEVKYRPVFSRSRKTGVVCFRFWLSRRRSYYKSVYPRCICLGDTLTFHCTHSNNDFYFVRFSIDNDNIHGERNYVLTLWY